MNIIIKNLKYLRLHFIRTLLFIALTANLILLAISLFSVFDRIRDINSLIWICILVFNIVVLLVILYDLFRKRKRPALIHTSEASTSSKCNLHIRNYQGINDIRIEIPFDVQWIFFTGENGFGKSNILQALARVLSSEDDNRVYNGIRAIEKNTEISLEIDREIRQIKGSGFSHLPKSNFKVMGYGPIRIYDGKDSTNDTHKSALGLFRNVGHLRDIEKEGLSRWKFIKKHFNKYEQTVSIIKKLVPVIDNIEIDSDSRVWYTEMDEKGNIYPKVQIRDLAAGYQNIIRIVGDILLNLFDNADEREALNNIKAIVLIDEVELHLHPNWQKRFPLAL